MALCLSLNKISNKIKKEKKFMSLTLVSPASAMMPLNMVLQTKYEAMQEIVPSVPEKFFISKKYKKH